MKRYPALRALGAFLLAWMISVPVRGEYPGDELIRAIKLQDLSEMGQLVERGADVNAPDREGLSPLVWVAAGGNKEIVERLLAAGADVNGRAALGLMPLCMAAQHGHIDVLKLLVERGADLNAKTDSGWSALFYCSLSGAVPIMSVLLDNGAEVNPRDPHGSTPLIIASELGREPAVELLLNRGAPVNSRDQSGATALVAASYRGHVQVVKHLLDRRADVNIRDERGWTALMFASMIGHREVVDLLLSYGADVRVVTKAGETALSLAAERGHWEIVDMLADNGADVEAAKSRRSSAAVKIGSKKTLGVSELRSLAPPAQSARDEVVVEHAAKIAQLVGEFDRERNLLTNNRTLSRYKLMGTDLGVPFRHKDRTYLLFGDTGGLRGGDAIAYFEDTSPEDGIDLTFIHDEHGVYKPVKIPGISQSFFEVPTEGVSVNDNMYIYHTTDHTAKAVMGRSVLAVSNDDGHSFRYLYDVSTRHFINVSIVEVDTGQWNGLPESGGVGLMVFGSGAYRKSDVRLAFQPATKIESRESIRYFAGTDASGTPRWSSDEDDAEPLFHQPCIGEFSVSFNRHIGKWIMLYNCAGERQGIYMRTSDRPWGPWSESKIVFDAEKDHGYCRFIHSDWNRKRCDIVHDLGREFRAGAMYGPYQFEDLAVGNDNTTTIYFTVSTWNPYTVILMKATLRKISLEQPGAILG